MIKGVIVTLAAAALVLSGAAAAGAVETAEFGLEPTRNAEGPRQSFREGVLPGETTEDTFRVWNKTSEPLTVQIRPVAAEVGENGRPRLGGGDAAFRWAEVEPSAVTLGPNEEQQVRLAITAPDEVPAGSSTFALLAEPVFEGSEARSVVARLAVMVYVTEGGPETVVAGGGAGSSGSGGLALLPVLLAALLLGLVAAAVLRRRRDEGSGRVHPAGQRSIAAAR